MKRFKLNIQFFGEGAGTGASAGTGAEGSGAETGSIDLASQGSANNGDNVDVTEPQGETAKTPQQRQEDFEALIRGEYREEFQKRTQRIIDKRFKQQGELENTLKSHDELLTVLAQKYGVDSRDAKAIMDAINKDDSFYEQEALDKGLSVKQLKEIKQLERDNASLRKAQEEAESKRHTDQIYSEWLNESEELKNKYGLDSFNLESEIQNPEFIKLLAGGISLESAYKAIHFDDMVGGAMAHTAATVKEKMANNIASRSGRPAENGVSSQSTSNFKTDVNKMTKADRAKIMREVQKGANVVL
nr:MAG TPA: hypothetical protein [Caudoviricetes sp.]